MLTLAEETFSDNGITNTLFGIAWCGNKVCFTENRKEAENLICFLVENDVEENQVMEVIEDLYYT